MIQLLRTTSADLQFGILVSKLEQELRARYGSIQDLYDQHNKVVNINTAVVAYKDNDPAGCGCIKEYDKFTVEIKRMFVDMNYRGQGISKLILTELETWAQQLGYKKVMLETGLRQPESLALYKKCGYKQISNYEPYMEMVESICFSKEF